MAVPATPSMADGAECGRCYAWLEVSLANTPSKLPGHMVRQEGWEREVALPALLNLVAWLR